MQNAKEYEQLLKKQRQLDIADQLSRKDTEDYGDDILNYMHEQEVSHVIFLLLFEPQLIPNSSNVYLALPLLIFRLKSSGI